MNLSEVCCCDGDANGPPCDHCPFYTDDPATQCISECANSAYSVNFGTLVFDAGWSTSCPDGCPNPWNRWSGSIGGVTVPDLTLTLPVTPSILPTACKWFQDITAISATFSVEDRCGDLDAVCQVFAVGLLECAITDGVAYYTITLKISVLAVSGFPIGGEVWHVVYRRPAAELPEEDCCAPQLGAYRLWFSAPDPLVECDTPGFLIGTHIWNMTLPGFITLS